jgi:V8-like Glu-specific endopeptidase
MWDDHPRRPVTSHMYPWRCIGWIDNATGTMVGPDLVLTAAHVVMDPQTHHLRKELNYFYVNRVGADYYKRSWIDHVWWGTDNPDGDREHDWAILKLADRLGDEVGWMGVANTNSFHVQNFPAPLTVAGYSGDYDSGNTATVDQNVTIHSISSGLLHHDGSTSRGSSGCPIFQYVRRDDGKEEAVIYGVNVAENRDNGETSLRFTSYDAEHSNTAVETYTFLGMLKKLRAEQPKPPKLSASALAEELAKSDE